MCDRIKLSDRAISPEFGATPVETAPSRSAPIYLHPEDVVSDRRIDAAEKRAILASWVSDAHAVTNVPALRQLDNGAIVHLDDVYRALRSLDGEDDAPGIIAPPRLGSRWRRRERASVARWLRGSPRWHRRDNGDEDPPPSPASAPIPPRIPAIAA
jgi:hypothetical protein